MAIRIKREEAMAEFAARQRTGVSDALVEQMLSALDIAEILEREYDVLFVEEGSGGWWSASCPLPGHRDSTPSFGVHPEQGIFNCFGCLRGGNLLRFVQLMEGLSYRDAVLRLSEWSGIAESEDSGVRRMLRDLRAMTEEFLTRQAATQLPGGMSEAAFVRMMADRLRGHELQTGGDESERRWVDAMYAHADALLFAQDQRGLTRLWQELGPQIKMRRSAFFAAQQEEGETYGG